ncbi:MAG: MmgE/PrpD family protein, partial [Clostridia bacterium]|nr:MmgE/PrpD family protein [Clostridia bacterium]
EDAAMLNGIAAHYFELDDGSRFGMVHIGAPVFSALLAVADLYKITFEDFLYGALTGYEITVRLASAIQPGHKKKGFHATGTCGCIGAAAAVAVSLKYNEQALENTIAAAVAGASGLLEMIDDVSQLKPFNAGKAAQTAITAARIGQCGFSGPINPVGGKRGFLGVMTDSFDSCWFDRQKKEYAILDIYKKPYASCRHCHSAVEAAISLGRQVNPDQIAQIDVVTYGLAVFGHDHTDIRGISSAKMSIPYSVAAAICLHTGGIDAMSEGAVANKDILNLAKKVRVIENAEFSKLVPAQRIAEVVIHLKDGEQISKKVIYPKGEPENPISAEELKDKFKQMATHSGKSVAYCEQVIEYISNLETSFYELLHII